MLNYDDRAAIMQQVRAQITAIFEGSEQVFGEGELDVEVLEVAPCDEEPPTNPLPPATGSDREEAESLRSSRSGLVRRMVDVFSRFKP